MTLYLLNIVISGLAIAEMTTVDSMCTPNKGKYGILSLVGLCGIQSVVGVLAGVLLCSFAPIAPVQAPAKDRQLIVA